MFIKHMIYATYANCKRDIFSREKDKSMPKHFNVLMNNSH